MADFFLFQMAILAISMSARFGGMVVSGTVGEDVHANNDQKRRGGHRHKGSQLETLRYGVELSLVADENTLRAVAVLTIATVNAALRMS
jgi:hypothetical protein